MRLVSLLASATEMLAELDALDQLVGRSHECDYPQAVCSLPAISTVTIDTTTSSAQIDAQIKQLANTHIRPLDATLQALSIYAINLSLLQELRPDVIFTQTQCDVCAVSERDVAQAVEQLTGLRPRIVALSPQRLEDVWEDMLRVGKAIGREELARERIQTYRARLEKLGTGCQKLAGEHPPRVAILEWLDPLMGAGNWTPELVSIAGGKPLFGEIGQHTPWLSWAELQASDPEVLIISPCGFTLTRTLQEIDILQRHPAWRELRAVKEGRVYAIDGNDYLNRSGPRLVESAELLAYSLWDTGINTSIQLSAWQHIQL